MFQFHNIPLLRVADKNFSILSHYRKVSPVEANWLKANLDSIQYCMKWAWSDSYLALATFEVEGNLIINCLTHVRVNISGILFGAEVTWKDPFASKSWVPYYPLTSQMMSILVNFLQFRLSNIHFPDLTERKENWFEERKSTVLLHICTLFYQPWWTVLNKITQK